MKYGAVYQRRGKFILHADSKTTAGVLIGVEPMVVLDETVDAATLGRTLRQVLNHSQTGVRHPNMDEWDAVAAPLYSAAGVKSWGTFVRGSLLTSVEVNANTMRLLPQENRGARDGFQPMGLRVLEVATSISDAELGEAVLQALSIARSRETGSK
jgi:hypothetical protein